MMKKLLFILLALTGASPLFAQEPLYIVNGEVRTEIASIPPELIEQAERLPADEETIALYGPDAANGVLLITLRLDTPASFPGCLLFGEYIASQVEWKSTDPAARVILRYTITTEGRIHVDKELESTDSRLRRRVLKAVGESPLWRPATKNGVAVESQGILRIQLPEGKPMPRETELIWR